MQACLRLARALGQKQQHSEALRGLAGRLTAELEPLGIRSHQQMAARGEDDSLSEPSLPTYSDEEDWAGESGWEGAAGGAAVRAGVVAGRGALTFRQQWNQRQVPIDRILLTLVLVSCGAP